MNVILATKVNNYFDFTADYYIYRIFKKEKLYQKSVIPLQAQTIDF